MIRQFLPTLFIGSVLALGNTAVAAPPDDNALLQSAIRHELALLPTYNVFEWLEAETIAGGKIILRGEVLRHATREDAENRVKQLEGVSEVINNIRVAQISPSDDRLRVALYRAIFSSNSLYRYAMQAVPSIHIMVDNGRAVLKGVVANAFDSQLAYTAARQVPGLFDVRNELQIETH